MVKIAAFVILITLLFLPLSTLFLESGFTYSDHLPDYYYYFRENLVKGIDKLLYGFINNPFARVYALYQDESSSLGSDILNTIPEFIEGCFKFIRDFTAGVYYIIVSPWVNTKDIVINTTPYA